MIRSGFSILLPLWLMGCATNLTHTPTAKLCVDYLSSPSYNVYRAAREAELAARKEDCSTYTSAGIAQRQANDALLIEGARLMTTPPPQPRRPVNCYTNPYGYTVCN